MGDGFLQSVPASGADWGSDGVNPTNLDIVYAAEAGKRHIISGVMWGFYGPPAAGTTIAIYDGDGTSADQIVFRLPINADGVGYPVKFDPHKRGTLGNAMVIRITDGGGGNAELNALGHYTQG